MNVDVLFVILEGWHSIRVEGLDMELVDDVWYLS